MHFISSFNTEPVFIQGERTHINVSTKQAHMTGIQFPVSVQGVESLSKLKNKEIQYVQLVSKTFIV